MKVKNNIHFNGKNVEEVFALQCVISIMKDRKGKPAVVLSRDYTKGRTIAHSGDHIVQFESGLWQVYGPAAAEKIVKTGRYE